MQGLRPGCNGTNRMGREPLWSTLNVEGALNARATMVRAPYVHNKRGRPRSPAVEPLTNPSFRRALREIWDDSAFGTSHRTRKRERGMGYAEEAEFLRLALHAKRVALRICISILPFLGCCSSTQTTRFSPTVPNAARKPPAMQSSTSEPNLVGFSIESFRAVPGTGSRVGIRFRLSNVSKSVLWLTYSFGVSPHGPGVTSWLEVTDLATNNALPWHCSEAVAIGSGEPLYILLGPGDEYSNAGTLECFLPAHHATIRVVAHYQDSNTKPPRAPSISSWFNGHVISNVLEIEVPELDF